MIANQRQRALKKKIKKRVLLEGLGEQVCFQL